MDAEDGPLRVGEQWKAAFGEPAGEGLDERLEGLSQDPLVLLLPRLEPRTVVVAGEIREELDRIRAEAIEACHDASDTTAASCLRSRCDHAAARVPMTPVVPALGRAVLTGA
jgi:hypothetical protein